MKCDYCDQRATTLAGDTNGVLVCEDHVRPFAEREMAAAIPDQITPGRIPPAYHEHDAAGCLDCDCNAAPWSAKTPCTCLATIRRVARPRGELSPETLRGLARLRDRREKAEAVYRKRVLAALDEGSFSEVSKATGLSTNTLQRWKREAGK